LIERGLRKMSEPYRYRKKLISTGNSKYVLIPADWKHHDDKEVIVEVYDNKVIIKPVK